jgi:sec-independent protein translocase protein TatA
MGSFSIWHLLVVLVVAMLLFGAGRVADIGKGLGEGIRNFKKGLKEDEEDVPRAKRKAAEDEDEEVEVQVVKVPKKQLPEAAPKKKKVIQVEVEEDADEEEIARRIAAKKREARASEDEKAT